MKVATVHSVCECQAGLSAELDEKHAVIRGSAKDSARHRVLPAPANAMPGPGDRFSVGWACPICTRNVLRSFAASGLSYREA
jgi:hypothetical protein